MPTKGAASPLHFNPYNMQVTTHWESGLPNAEEAGRQWVEAIAMAHPLTPQGLSEWLNPDSRDQTRAFYGDLPEDLPDSPAEAGALVPSSLSPAHGHDTPICQNAVRVADNLPVGDEGIVDIARRIDDPEDQAAAAGRGVRLVKSWLTLSAR